MSNAQAVQQAARSFNRDRYLSALLAPGPAQQDLVTLAAYFGELKRIPIAAREAEIGEIKFQWWRDVLAAGSPTGHPIADAVIEIAARRALPRDLLVAPLEGYARELYEDGIADTTELARYGEETEGAAIRLGLAVLGDTKTGSADLLSEPAARCLALTRLALTLPEHLAHGRLPVPANLVAETGDPRSMGRSEASGAARNISQSLADQARLAGDAFRAGQARVSSDAFSVFLPLCLVAPYFRAMIKPSRDVLRDVADISPLSRVMRLWFAHWRRRV